jgi:hypothetical protein
MQHAKSDLLSFQTNSLKWKGLFLFSKIIGLSDELKSLPAVCYGCCSSPLSCDTFAFTIYNRDTIHLYCTASVKILINFKKF